MSNADLIVRGSIHQADRRFSDISRGRQCAFSTVAGQNILGGGGGGPTWPSETYGGPGEKPLKIIEIFIFEIAANASNFKN